MNDPGVGGIGENTYVTVQHFLNEYFEELNVPGDRFHGQYLAITDPPRDIDVEIPDNAINYGHITSGLTASDLDAYKGELKDPSSDSLKEKIINAMGDQTLMMGNGPVTLRASDHHVILNMLIAEVSNGRLLMKKDIGPVAPADQCAGRKKA